MTCPLCCIYIGTSVVASKNDKQMSPVVVALAKFAVSCVVLSLLWWFIGGPLACIFDQFPQRSCVGALIGGRGAAGNGYGHLGAFFGVSAVLLCICPAAIALYLFLQARKEQAQAQISAQISQVPV
jgi:hypothetical protein